MHTPTHSLSIHRLRMRLKALQQVIESQNMRLAELQVSGGRAGEVTEDTSTGQCECASRMHSRTICTKSLRTEHVYAYTYVRT